MRTAVVNSRRQRIGTTLLLCACAAAAAFGQAGVSDKPKSVGKAAGYAVAEQAVTKLEQEWFAIQLAHDWAKLNHMIAEDFLLVESDGSLGNRESMIDGYKAEAAATANISMSLIVSHAVAPNTVIATGLDDITLRDKDGRLTHRYERFIDTWVLRDGRWQCVAEQLTLANPAKR